jgi:hypothetical protein
VFATTVHTPLDEANVRRYFGSICRADGIGEDWAPRELRTSFVHRKYSVQCWSGALR